MRRLLISLIFVLFVCFASTSEARKLALLVGVDAYDDVPSLKCCVNDVKVLKEALIKVGFEEDDIQILATGTDNYPTKKRIERKLKEMFEQAGSRDMVFLSFSGHGAQDGKRVYFCPPDVDLEDLDGTCVSIDRVMKDLEKCNAKFKWVVVDACRNDPAEGARSIGGKGLQVIPTPPAGIALFQSCAKGEQSWEDRTSGNGFFTKNFAAALSGEADANHDGQLTLMEVCSWTTAQTKEQVKASQNKSQKPYFSGTVSDFTLTEDLNVPKAKALAEEAQKAMDAENYALAIEKYDAALALCPQFEHWKRERKNAQKFLEQEKRIKEAEEKARETAKRPSTQNPFSEETPASPKVGVVHHGTPSSVKIPTQPKVGVVHHASSRKAGERMVLRADGIGYAFRWCPPGEFMMGSTNGDDDEKPVHKVKLTNGFWMLETEVTQAMWQSVMGESIGSKAKQGTTKNDLRGNGANYPMYYVSWEDCQVFCLKLSQKLQQQVQLPTEAQWEYACRADTNIDYGRKNSTTWYYDNSDGTTHMVGQKKPNAWGLYDMQGNVCEWCSDYYDKEYYTKSPERDPENTTVSSFHVNRSGGWDYGTCRSADRFRLEPSYQGYNLGLRVILLPSQD